uniref:Uncharacterized protein n=1 Tax=Arundo donax TaxID=35708 RepID=A0A0A9HEH6_ARUDO
MFIAWMQVCSSLFGIFHVCPYFIGCSTAAEDYMEAVRASTFLGCFWVLFSNNYGLHASWVKWWFSTIFHFNVHASWAIHL